ncbi:MAG: hypothetical protein QOC91_915, partial [Solirubrobacteraceae bacterium]|nr:hypothetical protein [Solirubrobacteraceae bacterium]
MAATDKRPKSGQDDPLEDFDHRAVTLDSVAKVV